MLRIISLVPHSQLESIMDKYLVPRVWLENYGIANCQSCTIMQKKKYIYTSRSAFAAGEYNCKKVNQFFTVTCVQLLVPLPWLENYTTAYTLINVAHSCKSYSFLVPLNVAGDNSYSYVTQSHTFIQVHWQHALGLKLSWRVATAFTIIQKAVLSLGLTNVAGEEQSSLHWLISKICAHK